MSTAVRRHTISNTTQLMDIDDMIMVEDEGVSDSWWFVFSDVCGDGGQVVSDGGNCVLSDGGNCVLSGSGGCVNSGGAVMMISCGQAELVL